MKVVDIANEIYIEQGSPTTTSIPAIAFWIRAQTGFLNTLLFEDLSINSSLELVKEDGTEVPVEIVSIIKQAYRVYDLEMSVRTTMNALATDTILTVKDNLAGTSFTRVNRNEISKTYLQMRRDEQGVLTNMINAYRLLKAQPSQIAGDDTYAGYTEAYPAYYPLLIRRY